jgi:peroxiredoxin
MMQKYYDMMKKADIMVISVFRSTPENVANFASESIGEGMLALSDRKGSVYKSYNIQNPLKAFIAGEVDGTINFRKKYKRFFRWSGLRDMNMGGVRLRPADILINEDGIVVDLFRAFDEPNQLSMPFDRIEAFIPEERRCRCNKKDCISPKCRANWKENERRNTAPN